MSNEFAGFQIAERSWHHAVIAPLINSITRFVSVVLVFSAATAIFFWEWLPSLPTALIGPPEDNMQDFWNTWYGAFAHGPGDFFFTNLIRFPEGTPLVYHSFAFPKVIAITLISKVFGLSPSTLILQQNLSLLISFPLAGTGAFYLVRHFLVRYFAASTSGALLGGYVFAFNPSHVEHVMHHASVSSIEFIPFFVLAYLLAVERKSFALMCSAIALFALSALSCWYYLFYGAYFIAFQTLFVAVRDRSVPRSWQLLAPILCLAGVVAVLSPLIVPMVSAATQGASVYVSGWNTYVADLFGYLAFPRFHLLAPLAEGVYRQFEGNVWEATVYLGWVNLAVLAWLFFAQRGKSSDVLKYVICGMAVFGILSSGNWLHILGHNTIPMPDIVLSKLPFFKNVRAPSRAVVFVYLFMAIGVGYAVAWVRAKAPGSRSPWVAAVMVLIVLDFFPARPLPMTPVVCSPGFAVIRDDPEKNFGVLDLPIGGPADYVLGNLYMLQQTCHGRPIAEGNTSRNLVVTLRDRLEVHDFEAQRRQLVSARVKYVVINREPMGIPLAWVPANGAQEEYVSFYPIVYNGPDITVLRVY